MLALKPGLVLTLKPGIVLHSLPDQDWFFAFNVMMGDQFRLNRTSFWVLETISNGTDWVHLRDSFLETFDVSAPQGEAELRKLLNELYKQKIIGRQGHGEEENCL